MEGFSIAAVERDVGLSKEVLRVWERRYGFPSPARDVHGERVYPAAQVTRLRLVKRLMDQGYRPGRLLRASEAELEVLGTPAPPASPAAPRDESRAQADVASANEPLDELFELVVSHDAAALLKALRRRLARAGLRSFVQDIVTPMAVQIGQAWQEGRVQVHEEHLFTEQVARVLREAIAAVPQGDRPRVLLTTVPNEQHGLGLLMLEAMLALEGASCIPLGTQMPLLDIVAAARAHRADAVALSFSAAFPVRQVVPLLAQLRDALPPAVEVWAGGSAMRRLRSAAAGVVLMTTLEDGLAAVERWQRQRAAAPVSRWAESASSPKRHGSASASRRFP